MPRRTPATFKEGIKGANSAPFNATGARLNTALSAPKSTTLVLEIELAVAGLIVVLVTGPVRVNTPPVFSVGAFVVPLLLLKTIPASVLLPASVTVEAPFNVTTFETSRVPPRVCVNVAALNVSPPAGSLPVAASWRVALLTTVPPM